MNVVILVGRFTRPLDLKQVSSGNNMIQTTLAVKNNFKNKTTNDYDSTFVPITIFGQTATFVSDYLKVGDLVSITGRFNSSIRQNADGTNTYFYAVIAENVTALESRSIREARLLGQDNYNNKNQYQSNSNQAKAAQNPTETTFSNDNSNAMDDDDDWGWN